MAITANNSLRVDQNTTIHQLKELMDRDAGAKVYGRKNEDGSITLYRSDKNSSNNLIDRMTGRAAERRQVGREGLQQIFYGALERQGATGVKYGANALLKNVKRGINPSDVKVNPNETDAVKIKKTDRRAEKVIEMKTHAVRTDTVKKYLDLVLPAADKLKPTASAPKPMPKGLSFAETGMANKVGLLRNVAADLRIANADGLHRLAKDYGDVIEASYRQRSPSANKSEALALSGGARMKRELAGTLGMLLGGAGMTQELKDKVESFADAAINRASSKAVASAGNFLGQVVANDERTIDVKGGGTTQVSPIVIGGKTYIPQQHLARGGYGDVFVMENDEGRKVAYKLPVSTGEQSVAGRQEKLDAGAAEIAAHKAAATTPHPNVLGMECAVRTEDGRLGIVMEYVPGGNLEEFSKEISRALANGDIIQGAADAIRMTLVKEMAEGLKHLHNNGVTHYDFNPRNCMIDANGHIKICDFGESFVGDKADVFSLKKIENPEYKAPDMLLAEIKGAGDFAAAGDAAVQGDVSGLVTHLKARLPGPETQKGWSAMTPAQQQAATTKHDAEIDKISKSIMAPRSNESAETAKAARPNNYEVSNKVDVWGLGTVALQLFNGDTWIKRFGFMSSIEDALVAFADPANGSKPAVSTTSTTVGGDGLFDGSLLPATSFAEGNAFVNDLLMPSASNRPGMDDVVDHAAFSAPGVGTPEANFLLRALVSGDAAQIKSTNDALLAKDAVMRAHLASFSPFGTVVEG